MAEEISRAARDQDTATDIWQLETAHIEPRHACPTAGGLHTWTCSTTPPQTRQASPQTRRPSSRCWRIFPRRPGEKFWPSSRNFISERAIASFGKVNVTIPFSFCRPVLLKL